MPRAAVPPHGGVLRSLDERVLREIAGRNHRRLDRRLLRAVPLRHRDLLLPVLRGFVVRLALLPLLLSGPRLRSKRCVQIGRCVSEDISAGSALRDSLDWVTDDESGDFLSELVRPGHLHLTPCVCRSES